MQIDFWTHMKQLMWLHENWLFCEHYDDIQHFSIVNLYLSLGFREENLYDLLLTIDIIDWKIISNVHARRIIECIWRNFADNEDNLYMRTIQFFPEFTNQFISIRLQHQLKKQCILRSSSKLYGQFSCSTYVKI